MATRTANTTNRKTSRKSKLAPVEKTQTPTNQLNHLNKETILRNKKLVALVVLIILFVILLLYFFKGLFIAAMVNGEPITRLSVVKALEKQGGKATLESLITKKLILQEAKKRNVTIAQNDIDAELKKIEASLKNQGTTIDQALKSQGMTKAQLNEEIRLQLSVQRMVEKNVLVTDKEVEEFVTQNKNQFPEGTAEEKMKEQAKEQLQQQKLQKKTQGFIKSLQNKAKIINFVSY